MTRTLVGLATLALATLATLAVHPAAIGGQATMAPAVCTAYENGIRAASLDQGYIVRLACVDGRPV